VKWSEGDEAGFVRKGERGTLGIREVVAMKTEVE
jgi:hypothetical protein